MKIGILTKYYGNKNYGGLLQSYALVQYLRQKGYDAEQISFKEKDCPGIKRYFFGITRLTLLNILLLVCKKLKEKKLSRVYKDISTVTISNLKARYAALEEFQYFIPHSDKIYDSNTISECNDAYDIVIVGSDQVWNLEWYNQEYFLDFVEKRQKKISYAASMPKTNRTS